LPGFLGQHANHKGYRLNVLALDFAPFAVCRQQPQFGQGGSAEAGAAGKGDVQLAGKRPERCGNSRMIYVKVRDGPLQAGQNATNGFKGNVDIE
jgi:hypothetical protein